MTKLKGSSGKTQAIVCADGFGRPACTEDYAQPANGENEN